jgi:isocitrate dehydrogenase kinase/phosphatase
MINTKDYREKYYQAHKEELKKRAGEKIQCECGKKVCRSIIAKHRKTKKHLAWEKQQQNNKDNQTLAGLKELSNVIEQLKAENQLLRQKLRKYKKTIKKV